MRRWVFAERITVTIVAQFPRRSRRTNPDEDVRGDALVNLHGIRAGNVKRRPALNADNDGASDATRDANASVVVGGI